MDEYTKLKNQVLDELVKITEEDELSPQEKFEFLMTQYIGNGDFSLLTKAFHSAQKIEEISERGQALMQLLEEIDIAQIDSEPKQEADATNISDKVESEQSVSVDN